MPTGLPACRDCGGSIAGYSDASANFNIFSGEEYFHSKCWLKNSRRILMKNILCVFGFLVVIYPALYGSLDQVAIGALLASPVYYSELRFGLTAYNLEKKAYEEKKKVISTVC